MLRIHPDLAGRVAQQGALTSESTEEQTSAGLTELTEEELQLMTDRNQRSVWDEPGTRGQCGMSREPEVSVG